MQFLPWLGYNPVGKKESRHVKTNSGEFNEDKVEDMLIGTIYCVCMCVRVHVLIRYEKNH